LPHPALSKREGSKKTEAQALSFGKDLGEANNQYKLYKSYVV
jgi:hypothetical protein